MKQNGRKLSHFCWMLFNLFLILLFGCSIKGWLIFQFLNFFGFSNQPNNWIALNLINLVNGLIWTQLLPQIILWFGIKHLKTFCLILFRYRSSAVIPQDQLLMITGTSVPPNGSYAIVSTINIDTVNNSQSANLISALIPCQNNNATLTFK